MLLHACRWFESEILKTTLATDAVIGTRPTPSGLPPRSFFLCRSVAAGASCSPKHAGSAYVLLHHVMGEAAGKKGVWSYVQGGMGAISNAIASSARTHGAEIVTNATVKKILYAPAAGKGQPQSRRHADESCAHPLSDNHLQASPRLLVC